MVEFEWTWAALSDTGKVRAGNEDAILAAPDSGVFLVADGMGGHAAGEVASGIAAREIGDCLCAQSGEADFVGTLAREWFVQAFAAAAASIQEESSRDETRQGMGTTASVLFVRHNGCFAIGHIGDSRIYLRRNSVLAQVTRDHSWVQEQVDQGLITKDQARTHPQSNIITRALGANPAPPDVFEGTLEAGDLFLLTSDGLTDMVPDDRISTLLGFGGTTESIASRLVFEANLAGGRDNITVLLVQIHEGDTAAGKT